MKLIVLYFLFVFSILFAKPAFANDAIKNTTTKFTSTYYSANSNLLLDNNCKIKITNFKGKIVKVLDTSYLKNRNMPNLDLPKGRYFVWINVTDEKLGYWITI